MADLKDPDFDEPREHPGFRGLRTSIGRQIGCERLGLSLFEVPPGEAAYPFHYHLGEEEIVIVLEGRPSLRTLRFLAFSTSGEPDIVVQPDSEKVGVFERRPEGGGKRLWFRGSEAVDYYEGEEPPR